MDGLVTGTAEASAAGAVEVVVEVGDVVVGEAVAEAGPAELVLSGSSASAHAPNARTATTAASDFRSTWDSVATSPVRWRVRRPDQLRSSPQFGNARLVTGDGKADLYGYDDLRSGFMANHISGNEAWDILVQAPQPTL